MTAPDEQQNLDREEAAVAAVTAGVIAVWLAAVAAAVLTGPGIVLLGLFSATELWRRGVETIIAKCAAVTGVTDPGYWNLVRQHLLAIPDATYSDLQDVIQRSVNGGDSPAQTKAKVATFLDYSSSPHNWPFQADRIAVTETNAAHSAQQLKEAARAGYTTKTWEDVHDNRVRTTHRAARGQTVPIQQPYLVGGWPAMHPGDPKLPASERIGCRCKSKFGRRKR